MAEQDPEFADYVTANWERLRRTAFLLCGDWHRAEDLTQDAFTNLCVHWKRAKAARNLDGYARTVLVNAFLADQRRPWRRAAVTDQIPDTGVQDPDPPGHGDGFAALRSLGPSSRAVLVLRFWEDLSVEQTATILGCSTGNVKSQTARALARLRQVMLEEELS